MARATAKAAPEFTPSSPGSASGLRVSACMATPARARLAPTTTVSAVRGMRVCQTMTASGTSRLSRPVAVSPLHTSPSVSGLAPMAMPTTASPASTARPAIPTAMARLRRRARSCPADASSTGAPSGRAGVSADSPDGIGIASFPSLGGSPPPDGPPSSGGPPTAGARRRTPRE